MYNDYDGYDYTNSFGFIETGVHPYDFEPGFGELETGVDSSADGM